jgi:hypothetical protein
MQIKDNKNARIFEVCQNAVKAQSPLGESRYMQNQRWFSMVCMRFRVKCFEMGL